MRYQPTPVQKHINKKRDERFREFEKTERRSRIFLFTLVVVTVLLGARYACGEEEQEVQQIILRYDKVLACTNAHALASFFTFKPEDEHRMDMHFAILTGMGHCRKGEMWFFQIWHMQIRGVLVLGIHPYDDGPERFAVGIW